MSTSFKPGPTPFETQAVVTAQGEIFESLRLELRRGCLVLAVLAQLRQEHYGYTLRKSLSTSGLEIEESTLYPLLRRLETQGLLTSEWREEEKRNKRFYRLSLTGEAVLARLLAEWSGINASLERILGTETPDRKEGNSDEAATA
ncbi:MAG TPA: helix-turn-helix transcriptional regulator [Edaphobacter sp.]